jgi:hypothetical protein
VVVYGATPGGLAAAFAACEAPLNTSAAKGNLPPTPVKVLLIESTSDLGRVTSPGGIGLRDIGNDINKGYTREWAVRSAEHYNASNRQLGWKYVMVEIDPGQPVSALLDIEDEHCIGWCWHAVCGKTRCDTSIQPIAVSSATPADMTGLTTDLVQVFRTGLPLHWEFLRLGTGFELASSWSVVPCYGANRNRNILDFMRWPQIDLGAQNLNGFNGQNIFKTIAGSEVLDKYYNSYRRK